ncbi:acyl carrier protein [Azohydromonas caseinilytica]|uniref:Acyl carrier protein n=1 Tax=Azohydromonas caseinilytica TaxID=2728836 RepID=A0A848FCQ0_9BURK|nr:acyl carrier protein [Azohydromonas caseinilytica]NML17997.1 acyl carrier protein [Azohydromonas caseinilytica]
MSTNSPDLSDLQQLLVKLLARELRLAPEAVEADKPFTQYGLDSIAALTIAGDLEEELSIELESTVLWDCPTVTALAQHLSGLLREREPMLG